MGTNTHLTKTTYSAPIRSETGKRQTKNTRFPASPVFGIFLALVLFLNGWANPFVSQAYAFDATGEDSAALPTSASGMPSLREFIAGLETGQRDELVGVYAPGVLALPVEQQPANNASYVTNKLGYATQFRMAQAYNTTGLLAHNTLSGALFFDLQPGQTVSLVYGSGRVAYYQITAIETYRALTPDSPYSDFDDLGRPDVRLTASDLFNRIYAPGSRLVFQTCIARDGQSSWGRIFIVAEPYQAVSKAIWPNLSRLQVSLR